MSTQQYVPSVKFDDIPGQLPEGTVPEDTDITKIAQNTVKLLNSLQETDLHCHATWRDLLSFTGNFRTFYGSARVFNTFQSLIKTSARSDFVLKDDAEPRITKSGPHSSWLDVDVTFSTRLGELQANCMGTVSAIPNVEGRWIVWMLRTWVENFEGCGHPDQPKLRTTTNDAGGSVNGEHSPALQHYDAAIIGAGQAGLATAGRLQALGITYIVLEKHAEIGDTWSNRYESLRWHTSKEYGVLPFGHTFPSSDDYSLPAKRIGAGHKAWAEKYGINVRTGTTVESARWDDSTRKWAIRTISKDKEVTYKVGNLVLCIGPGHASPVYPSWAEPSQVSATGFKGTVLHAFDGYASSTPWTGKRGVVIGTANTAHDVAEDMANAGMTTTMIQRSPTFVFPAEWLHAAEDVHYRADTSAEEADKESFTYPNKILREMINRAVWAGIHANPDRFDALEKAGFQLDRYGDTYNNLYVRFGGHYVDIGASARIAKGEIKVKQAGGGGGGGEVKCLTEDGLLLSDGREIGADLIVLATGFNHNFRADAANIIGAEAAEKMDEYWGVDGEGEIRGHARCAGYPNLYYHGGDVRMARFFSRFIALQIQAEVLGTPLEPYRD